MSEADVKIIDLNVADEYTGGDREFLKECLENLMGDCDRCSEVIDQGIHEKDFKKIERAAHEIKGCSAYLGCMKLKEASLALEQCAKKGFPAEAAHEEILEESKTKFTAYKACVEEARLEVQTM